MDGHDLKIDLKLLHEREKEENEMMERYHVLNICNGSPFGEHWKIHVG
jgi:hypothetical protein